MALFSPSPITCRDLVAISILAAITVTFFLTGWPTAHRVVGALRTLREGLNSQDVPKNIPQLCSPGVNFFVRMVLKEFECEEDETEEK